MNYKEIIEEGKNFLRKKGLPLNYLGPGAETNYTAITNVEYFKFLAFTLRLLNSDEAGTETTIFGKKLRTPILSAALSGMKNITEDPLKKIAQGIKESGSMMWVGVSSLESLESVVSTGAPAIKIIKPFKDIKKIVKEVESAEKVGVVAVGIDVDFFLGGKFGEKLYAPGQMGIIPLTALRDVVSATKLPFILKGILSEHDAARALEVGAKGIVVSNHGAYIMDYLIHPLEVLPKIKNIIGDEATIFVDSGFRRGTDVLKALALGADAVSIGYLLMIALAANGSEGVRDIIDILTAELQRAMTLTGCRSISEVDDHIIYKRGFIIPT